MAITAQRLDAATPAAPSEDELLRQARQGDADALRAIYEQHARAVTQRLFRLCGDEEIARDLTQDAFVVALRRIAEHRGDAAVATWLHGIAYNLLRDCRRTQRRRRGLWQRWFGAHAEPDPGSGRGVAGVLEERQLLEQLDAALRALGEDQRDAFVLRVIEGLPLQEVSFMLGVPVSTVSDRRARRVRRIDARWRTRLDDPGHVAGRPRADLLAYRLGGRDLCVAVPRGAAEEHEAGRPAPAGWGSWRAQAITTPMSDGERPTREQAEAAVRTLIRWAGDDPDREGLRATPKRVAESYRSFFAGYEADPVEILSRTFEETNGYDEVVLLKDIRLESHCEHHMVPIIGRAHVAYLPDKRVVGISKLARVVDVYARRLQIQEKLTAQVANTIAEVLAPRGVAVVIDAAHQCMTTRGVHKPGVTMVTSSMLGVFRDNPDTRREFLSLIGLSTGITVPMG